MRVHYHKYKYVTDFVFPSNCGTYLTIILTSVIWGISLSAQDFHKIVYIRYGVTSKMFQTEYKRWFDPFSRRSFPECICSFR
jgi:hypothetical protein